MILGENEVTQPFLAACHMVTLLLRIKTEYISKTYTGATKCKKNQAPSSKTHGRITI